MRGLEATHLNGLRSSLISNEALKPIVIKFIQSLPDRIAEIARHHQNGDEKMFFLMVHQLKGAAASFGISTLHQIASNLECIERSNRDEIESLIADARSLIEQIQQVHKKEIHRVD